MRMPLTNLLGVSPTVSILPGSPFKVIVNGPGAMSFQVFSASSLVVDWGDGNQNTYNGNTVANHTYADSNLYALKFISGTVGRLNFAYQTLFQESIVQVSNQVPASLGLTSIQSMFQGCVNCHVFPDALFDACTGLTALSYALQGTLYDHSLGSMSIASVTYAFDMLSGSSMSTANYSATLIGWAAQAPNIPANITFGATGLHYNASAVAARAVLTGTYGWTITDAGL